MLCEVAQLCECPGDVAVRSPQAAVQTRSNLALGVSLRSIRRICVKTRQTVSRVCATANMTMKAGKMGGR